MAILNLPSPNARPRTRIALLALTATGLAWASAIATGAPAQDNASGQVVPIDSAVSVDGAVDFACKLQTGETFRYSIRNRHVRQHQKPDESIVKWITRRTAVISCEVLEPDPEIGPRVRVTFDELNITLMTPSNALRFTSANKHMNVVGAPMTLAMEPIVGAGITLTLDATGRIRKIEGADVLLKEKELRKYSEHVVGDEAINTLLAPIFHAIMQPAGGENTGPGTSRSTMDFPEFASFEFNERWTFNQRKAGRASFRVKSDTTATIDERWPDGVLSNSRSVGSYTWDELTGRLYHTEINRFYVVDLENDPDGPSIAGEEVLTISAPIGDD